MFRISRDMGIDLGTASVLIYVKDKGIVLREPSVIAIDNISNKVLAVGEEAKRMLGKTPGNIVAQRPMRDGVIADFRTTEVMLKYFIRKACGQRRLIKPRVVIGVPAGITEVERRAVLEASLSAGARKAFCIEQPLAAAIGAGINIVEPSGNMIVDIGGGTTNIAVISLGGMVVSQSLRIGGNEFDEAILRYVRKNYNLAIGERTAENVKIRIGVATMPDSEKKTEVVGLDMVTGLPKTIELSSVEVLEALSESLSAIIDGVREMLEKTPPELAADIMERGIIMTGGSSLLRNFDVLLRKVTGTPVYVAEDPISCVALGTGKVLEQMDIMKRQNVMGG